MYPADYELKAFRNVFKQGNTMTSTQQIAELQRQVWQIANDVRGSVDGWDFKQYVLGTLFYRFISENFALYIEGGFFGQEINHTTYNLARMNMFLHNINYDKFNIALGNTLEDPHFGDDKPFDAIVKNDYNLSVSAYVEPEDTREKIDISQLNVELKTTVVKIDKLRSDIDTIVAEIEA